MSAEGKSQGFTLRLTAKDQRDLKRLSDYYHLNRTDTLRRAVREAFARANYAHGFSGDFTPLRAGRRGRSFAIRGVRKGHPHVR